MPKGTSTQDVVRAFLTIYPQAATLTLARMAYRASPELWPNLDAARKAFRYARGANGDANRATLADKTHVRELQQPGDPFSELPEGLEEMAGWGPHVVESPAGRTLVICDPHVPYHALDVLRLIANAHQEVDNVILLGDVMDMFSASYWEKDPRERDFPYEIACGQEFFASCRAWWPDARIIYKLGNHDERLMRYMMLKAPDVLGVPEFELEHLVKCEEHKIEVVTDMRPIKLGALYLIHGHEYKFSMSNPVNPARGLFLRGKIMALCGHFHQPSHHTDPDMTGKVISTWSVGCACDLHPRYMPLNKWCHGFAVIDVDEKGGPRVHNYRIINGEIWN